MRLSLARGAVAAPPRGPALVACGLLDSGERRMIELASEA